MSRSLLTIAVALIALNLTAVAKATQDPLIVSPDAYRLEFENAWVKVVRVFYGPNTVIAPHFHTERASAYVYLNDGGPIVFKHEGLPYAGVTRPVTKAGSLRVYKGIREVHSVENPSATPSEFLRVEFKTEPLEENLLKGKFFREEPTPTATVQRTHFENAQVRITRILVAPGETMSLTTLVEQPALFVALTETGAAQAGSPGRQIEAGKTVWLDASSTISLGKGGTHSEVLRFDFKTGPMESR